MRRMLLIARCALHCRDRAGPAALPAIVQRVIPAPPAAGAAHRHRRAARRFPREIGQRHGLFRRRQLGLARAGAGDAGGPGAMAPPASRSRGPDRGPCRTQRHPRPCAGDRRPARAQEVRDYLVLLGVPAAQLTTTSWGKERPGRSRRARVTDRCVDVLMRQAARRCSRSRPSQARAWRWASAISRAVISSAISARHCWPRVQPDSAARLNHLCASMRSTGDAAAARRIGHAKLEQAHRHRLLRHRRAGCGSGIPRSSD